MNAEQIALLIQLIDIRIEKSRLQNGDVFERFSAVDPLEHVLAENDQLERALYDTVSGGNNAG